MVSKIIQGSTLPFLPLLRSQMGVDIDVLIVEVRKRPPLYDTANKEYHDRRLKKQLWEEVCCNLRSPDVWNAMNTKHKMKYEKEVLTKWNSLRTCFRRELRINQLQSDGVPEKKKRKYIYFDDLLFLLPFTKVLPIESLDNDHSTDLSDFSEEDTSEPKCLETQAEKLSDENYEEPMIPIETIKTETSQETDRNSELSELSDEEELTTPSRNESTHLIRRKRLTNNSDDNRKGSLLGNRRISKLSEIDEDEAFLCSLLPSIKEFSTEEKLRLRIELLTTILNFKKSNAGSSSTND